MRGRAAVLCYHDMAVDGLDAVPVGHRPYVLEPEEFRAGLQAVRATGRRTVTISELVADLGGGTVALTFDDGSATDYSVALPALRELGLRATFFVVPTLIDTPGYVSWAELREIVATGMEIGSHSMTHPFMDDLDAAGIRREFGESKRLLESRLGCAVRVASLPRGAEPPEFRETIRALGYAAFCTSRVGWWQPGADPFCIPRVAMQRGTPIETIVAIVEGEPRALWRLRALEIAKNAIKRCVGRRGWARIREPLLALREHL